MTMELELAHILENSLEESANILDSITDLKPFLRLQGFCFPPLPKLTKIYCTDFDYGFIDFFEGRLPVFRPILNFNSTFPNVQTIILNDSVRDKNRITLDTIPHADLNNVNVVPHFGIHSLDVKCNKRSCISRNLLEYFVKKFPNLTHVEFPPIFNFLDVPQQIWTQFNHLENVKIRFRHDYGEGGDDFFSRVEAALTGFSVEICNDVHQRITNGTVIIANFLNFQLLRVNPCILDVQSLQKLTIVLFGEDAGYKFASVLWKKSIDGMYPGFPGMDPLNPFLTATRNQNTRYVDDFDQFPSVVVYELEL